ncbi:MAG: hypothetical protein MJZ73_11500 [Bacteroidaceae bacterium]|nr:hypothetical protein [Bacteroidaceae bacterium]
MSKINKNGFLSGHTGDLVHREVKGKQIVQAMPSHYHDANTASQQKQRSGMRNIMAFYRLLKEAIKEQFEEATPLRRAYNCFIHHNLLQPSVALKKQDFEQGLCLLAPYAVSHGSLPSLDVEAVEGCVQFQMKSEEWKSGDILRWIQIVPAPADDNSPTFMTASFRDEIINNPEDKSIKTESLAHGAYSFIHMRDMKDKKWVSSQQLIII